MTAALVDLLPHPLSAGFFAFTGWQWIAIIALIVLIIVWLMMRRRQ